MSWEEHLPSTLKPLYEVHDHHHAAAILRAEFPQEHSELCEALLDFKFTVLDVKARGGNESVITKKFQSLLRPRGWVEQKMRAKMTLDEAVVQVDTHKVDYVKGRVACDFEWNSKDQTFDRDLSAFKAFFEYGRISVGAIVTRGPDLDPWFATLGDVPDKHGVMHPLKGKFGASTTRWHQVIRRLESGRGGGCPVLVFGISKSLITL